MKPVKKKPKLEYWTIEDAEKYIGTMEFLVPDWIPSGALTALIAESGIGKSWFALWLMRSIVTGEDWFNGAPGPKPGRVLWCDTESRMRNTIERINDCGIPKDKIILPFQKLSAVNLESLADLERIESLATELKLKAIFIDSLRGAHKLDENSSQIASILGDLASIAENTGTAIIFVHHTRKPIEDEELSSHSARGSSAIVAMAQVVIGFDKPNRSSEVVRARILKENIGIKPDPIGFTITDTGLVFGQAPTKQSKKERVTLKEQAINWLKRKMKPGKWTDCTEIINEAEALGFSHTGVLQQAREALKIVQPHNIRRNGIITEWRLAVSNS